MLERDRPLLLEDTLDVDPWDGREVDEDDDRSEAEPREFTGADGPFPVPGPEVTMVCAGRAEMAIRSEDRSDSTGCIRLLPIFVVSLLLITIP